MHPADQERARALSTNMMLRRILNKEVDPCDDTAMKVAAQSCIKDAMKIVAPVPKKKGRR